MGTLWPRVKRKKEDEEKEKRRERCREKKETEESKRKRKKDRERERSRASCSHYLTYYTGSMPPRPSRGPTSLHLASLGSPFALLTGLCPPPPRFASLSSCCPSAFSHPTASLAHPSDSSLLSRNTRAREIGLPYPTSCLPQPCPFLPLPSIRSRFLSFSIGDFFRAPRPHPPLPLPSSRSSSAFSSCSCSLFLLVRPHRAFSSTVRVREHREAPHRRIVSSRFPRLVRSFRFFSLPSSSSSSSSLFPLSFCLLSFRRLFLLRSPVVSPPITLVRYLSHHSTPCSRARARGAV